MAETQPSRASMEKLLDAELDDSHRSHDRALDNCERKSKTQTLTIMLVVSLFSNVLVLLLLVMTQFSHFHQNDSIKANTNAMTNWTSFTADHEYQSLDSKFDDEWNKLSVNTTGIIQDTDGRLGGIAMFHQLHCIAMLRMALQDASAGKDIGFDHHNGGHWPHCLDYMRKSTLCYADATVEKTDLDIGNIVETDEEVNLNISGQDPRWCRDSEVLYRRRESRKFVF